MWSLAAWIQHLGFLVMFAALSQILLPRGELRNAVRLVVGLVLIVAVVEPAAGWIARGDLPWGGNGWSWGVAVPGSDPAQRGSEVAAAALAEVEAAWRRQSERELAALFALIPGVEDAEVALFVEAGRVSGVAVTLVPEPGEDSAEGRRGAEERARRLAAGLLPGVPPGAVAIAWSAAPAGESGE